MSLRYQHGDVLLFRVDAIPASAKPKVGNILAEGEATGHAHRVQDVSADKVQLFEKDGTLYMRLDEPAVVRHEEHKPIALEPGNYKVGIVKEYDPFEEAVRAVRD